MEGAKTIIPFTRIVIIFLVMISHNAFSQQSGSVKGKVLDSVTNSNLSLATITVFDAKDTSIITYRLSDFDGNFKLTGIPLNKLCRVLISYSGYKVFRAEIELNDNNQNFSFGTVFLLRDDKSLDEVLIVAERPPIIVRNDTIEFNATSFKTLPNALLEDLLKKLPGVSVNSDGTITVNGRSVNRILVDSKEFFGGDMRIATRNLPADIIDKVQVIDDQNELDENLFANKATVGKVINLKLKKGVKKGVFGKAYAGLGTTERYETGGILNLFRDTLQISVLGFANNINKPGFGMDDIKDIGGFNRSGYNGSMLTANGGFSLDGISFGATLDGIQKSVGAGVNFNNEISKNLSLNLKYFFGSINSQYDEVRKTRQALQDTILETNSQISQNTHDRTHRVGGFLKWKLDDFSTITLRPTITFGRRDLYKPTFSNSIENIRGLLNESTINQNLLNDNSSFTNDLLYRRNFKKRGRSFAIGIGTNYIKSSNDQVNSSISSFYYGTITVKEINQLRIRKTPNWQNNISLSYSEPLTKTTSMQFQNVLTISKRSEDLATFDFNTSDSEYNLYNDVLSNSLYRNTCQNISSAGLNISIKKLILMPKISFEVLNLKNYFDKDPNNKQNYYYFLPAFSLIWRGVFFNYFSTVSEPRISDLQSVVDNSNPVYLQLGNPNLRPTRVHSVYVTYDKYDTKRSLTYRFLFSSLINSNAVVITRSIDSAGVQNTKPINTDGIYGFRSNINIIKEFKIINKWSVSLSGRFFADYNKARVFVNGNNSLLNNWRVSSSIRYSLNWKDKFEISQEFVVTNIKSDYSNSFFKNTDLINKYLTSEIIFRPSQRLVFESSLDFYNNPNISKEIQKNIFRWNAAFNLIFLKQDKGTIKLAVFDLLNQNTEVTRTILENYTSEAQIATLKRFFLVSFIYNIRDFKSKKIGGKDRLLLF